jgi:hypothetical protein
VSVICEAFGCTPAEALRQDWHLVEAVLDYRAARAAIDVMNGPEASRSFETLKRNPRLVEVLSMMARAQRGLPLQARSEDHEATGLDVASQYRTEAEVLRGPQDERG